MLNTFHKRLILLSIVLVCHVWGMAQCPETNPNCNQVNNWVFGDSVWLYFADTGIVQRQASFSNYEASSAISDNVTGELIFYQHAETIYNHTGGAVVNVKGGNSSTQGAYILQHPQTSMSYLSLTNDDGQPSYNMGLYAHLIDSNGVVLRKNSTLLWKTPEGLTVVNHGNENDIWLCSHDIRSDGFYFFLIKKGHQILCPVISNYGGDYSDGKLTNWFNGTGMKFSPNGKFLVAFGSESNLGGQQRIDVFKFNDELASISENVVIQEVLPYHAEFSANSQYLYMSSNVILRYDLSVYVESNIKNSRKILTPSWNNALGKLQLAPDGKMYAAYVDSSHLGVIINPNIESAKYLEKGLHITTGLSRRGLPNFNTSYFYTPAIDFAYTEDCWNHEYQFEGRDTLKATAFKWIFEKATVRDSILTKHCTYQFPDTGKWLVSHIASNGIRTDTVTKTLTIRDRWKQDMLGSDTFYCENDSIKLVLRAPENMHCVHWMGEEPNLDTAEGPILDYDHFHLDSMEVDTAGTYYIKVTNKTFCQTWDTITIVEGKMPGKPKVSDDSKELASTIESARYKWFLNDTFYFETSNRSFIPTENGYYQVQLLTEHGCESQLSDSFHYDKIGIVPVVNNLPFKVYPNPSDGKITIEVEKSSAYLIEVYDLTGKQVVKQHLSAGNKTQTVTIDVKGTHLLKVSDNEGRHAQRLIEVR